MKYIMFQSTKETGFPKMCVYDSASETDMVDMTIVCRQYVSQYEYKPLTDNEYESDYNMKIWKCVHPIMRWYVRMRCRHFTKPYQPFHW